MLIRPRATVHKKALTLGGATGFQINRWGKEGPEVVGEERAMKNDLEVNFPNDSRV